MTTTTIQTPAGAAPTNAASTTRECDRCHQLTTYEPIPLGERDLRCSIPFHCAECAEAMFAEEQAAARERQKAKRTAVWETAIPRKYRETEINHPEFNRALWDNVKSFDIFTRSIALIGPSGRSKTRVFALFARKAIALDRFVGWCPANSFQWAAQSQFDDEDGRDARQWLKRWKRADVLFLDDLGKHQWTDRVESEFFALIEHRSANNLPTHWSLNPDPADIVTPASLTLDVDGIMQRALDPAGRASARARFAPIVSRLKDGTEIVAVS